MMNEEKIKICIPEVRVEGEQNKKFVVFSVKVEGKSFVFRLYSHFLRIRKILCYRWPGIYIPFLSPKLQIVRKIMIT